MRHVARFFVQRSRSGSTHIAALATALVWAPASAQTGGVDGSTWAFGGGLSTVQKGYRAIDRDVLPLPLVSYDSKWISASVPVLDVKLYSNDKLSLRLRSRYARDGYNADDSPYLVGMADRKGSVWIGGAMIWRSQRAMVSAEVLRDASGYSQGARAKLQVDRRVAYGAFGVTPRLGIEWVDSRYVDYYYGVRGVEVRAGRAFYHGNSSSNVETGVRLDYSFSRHHTVFLDVRATRFGSAIKASPLVDQTGQAGVSLGYLYRF